MSAAIAIVADFNDTQATNPKCTPHARFRVVWQVLSYVGVASYVISVEGPNPQERLYLAPALSMAIYGSFFAAVVPRPIFGGELHTTTDTDG
jgi:hypothetical protein